jgi:hypothetical protein
MDERIKALWIEDLRSGKHQQGRGQLHDPDAGTWCCLGRLCDRAVAEGVGQWNVDGEFVVDGVPRSDTMLPYAVQSWAGLNHLGEDGEDPIVGEVENANYRTSLSQLNDRGVSFTKIADVIERDL